MHPNVFLFAEPPFSPEQKVLWNALKSGTPVPISDLFEALNRTPGIYSLREKQQRISGPIAYMNKLLAFDGLRIVPGEPRGTYRVRKST